MIQQIQTQRLLGFIEYLRAEDFCLGVKESEHALEFISNLSELDQSFSKLSLRSIACRNQDEWNRFDKLFNQYWHPKQYPIVDIRLSRKQQGKISGFGGSSMNALNLVNEDSGLKGSGAGKQTTITKADYRFISDQHQMRKLERLAERLAYSLRKKLSRKKVYRKHGTTLEVRRTLRRNLTNGGMPISRIYKRKELNPPNIVILHDISHSMSWNNPLLFRFARGLVRTCKSCEAYAFHTELFPVTKLYRQQSLIKMREQLESNNHLWLGGTCIAKSINQFNAHFANTVLKKDSLVLIISDGFDTDEPDMLNDVLKILSQKAKKIIWLSPMLERIGKENIAESMKRAMDSIDVLLPAHSLAALEDSVHVIKQYS